MKVETTKVYLGSHMHDTRFNIGWVVLKLIKVVYLLDNFIVCKDQKEYLHIIYKI
jgi:hypothetical protein